MYVQEKIASKKFIGKTSKDAYLKACRWIYENIYISQDEIFKRIQCTVEPLPEESLPSCRLSIYCFIEEEEVFNSMCKACEEVHRLFYLNDKKECATCKIEPFRKRIKEKLSIVNNYYTDELFRKGKDGTL